MDDLHIDCIPPYVQHLQRVKNGDPIPAETEEVATSSEFRFYIHPFAKLLSQDAHMNLYQSQFWNGPCF